MPSTAFWVTYFRTRCNGNGLGFDSVSYLDLDLVKYTFSSFFSFVPGNKLLISNYTLPACLKTKKAVPAKFCIEDLL